MASKAGKTTNPDELIALAEKQLSELGIEDASLYHHDRIVRIQVSVSDFERAVQMREKIVARMKAIGYRFVALDLQGK